MPTSSNWKSDVVNKLVSLIKFLKSCSPIFRASIKVPILDDLINISSTDKFLGNCLMSEISWTEHFIFLGIFWIIVLGETKFLSKAKATVKVLKIDPNS